MTVYTSVYALLMSAPDVGALRARLALLCEEKRLGESLTYRQLQEMLGALEEHEENAALTEEILDIQKDNCLSFEIKETGV